MRQLAADWRKADLPARDAALCAYADKLTRAPTAMTEADVATLQHVGFDDTAIHDATQIAAYFNYINRVADALGVEVEKDLPAWESSNN